MQLQNFKSVYLEFLLSFLWRQWSCLGVAGSSQENDSFVIDPEALLLFTASIGRYDQRLFDEMLDWLNLNERFINVQRLRNILNKESFYSKPIINAIAENLRKNKKGVKWKKLSQIEKKIFEPEKLFFLKTGIPMPVMGEVDEIYMKHGFIRNPVQHRNLSLSFTPGDIHSLLLEMRAYFGINSRAEVILYLLILGEGNIQAIADETYYSWRSIQEVLFEIAHTSLITYTKPKKARTYYMDSTLLRKQLLKDPSKEIQWINWPPFFRALEIIWLKLNDEAFLRSSTLEQAAEIRKLMDEEIIIRLSRAGFGAYLNNTNGYKSEEYLKNWIETIEKILQRIKS